MPDTETAVDPMTLAAELTAVLAGGTLAGHA
jgi:hypothetical protein